MRIISPFKDYYDGVQRVDQDYHVWKRTSDIIEENLSSYPIMRTWSYQRYVHYHIIGFCGRFYPIIETSFLDKVNYNPKKGYKTDRKYFIDLEEALKYIPTQLNKHEKKSFDRGYYKKDLTKWFNEVVNLPQKDDLFIKYKTPIMLLSNDDWNKIEINPCLQYYEFYKYFDAYRTYQEISMYFNGPMSDNKEEIPEISNADMIAAKGFNKYSFRKDKSK